MNSVLQIFLLGCAILFSTFVIRLLLKNKISEKNSVIWLGGLLVIFFLSGNPNKFDEVAKQLGISYPPALLFFISSLILLTFNLYQTVQITKLSTKIKNISQFIALNDDEKQHPKCATTQMKNEHECSSNDK